MKCICFSLFIMLFSCTPKSGLHSELEKAIREYQTKVPIPQSNDLKNYVFIYEVNFDLNNNDTIIHIVRLPSGIHEKYDCYGIYKVGNQQPVVIYDEKNLTGQFVVNKVKNVMLKEYEVTEKKRHYADYPPVYSYVIRKDKINFVKVDTISDNWKR